MATARIEDCEAKRETDKALLVDIDGDLLWVPKSVIHDDSEVWEEGQKGDLVVEEWWYDKNGFC
jgi:hypothetical protein